MLEKNKEIIKLKALLESASSIIGDANIPGTAEFLKEVQKRLDILNIEQAEDQIIESEHKNLINDIIGSSAVKLDLNDL